MQNLPVCVRPPRFYHPAMRYHQRIVVIACVLLCARITLAQSVKDTTLQVQKWITGLDTPTSMAFLPNNTALILEKDTGKVKLMANRKITKTVLDVPVA